MKTIITLFRTRGAVTVATVLAIGVLSGCEYCQPALLGFVALSLIYRIGSDFHDALQIRHCYQ